MSLQGFSVALIAGFALARLAVERTQIRLRMGRLRIHHWMWATAALGALLFWDASPDWAWGGLVGVALEGLRRKKWGWNE